MIKVIFVDTKDGEHQVVSYEREHLKNDSFTRTMFALDVEQEVQQIFTKLGVERKEENRCKLQSKP